MEEKFESVVTVIKDFKTIGKIKITWTVHVETRNWGLKGIALSAPDQTCEYISIEEDETGEDADGNAIYEPMTKDTEIKLENIQIDVDMTDRKLYSDLYPTELEIYKKETILKF